MVSAFIPHLTLRDETHPSGLVEVRLDGRGRGMRWEREKPAMCPFPPRAVSVAQAWWWRGDPLHSRVQGLYLPWPILIPEPRLCLEVTSDCPLPVGLPEPSPRSREILAPVRSSQGWWETTLEFIFIICHEQCAQHTRCKQSKSGLSNGDLKSSLRWVATGLVHQLSEGQGPSSSYLLCSLSASMTLPS